MLSWPTKLLLFMSSYLPLWAIFVLVDGVRLGLWVLLPIVCGVAGVAGLWFLGWWTKVSATTPLLVQGANRIDKDNVTYVLTYIFPFVGVAVTTQPEAFGLAILFVVVALVYVGADMIYVNPILTLFHWRVYQVVSRNGNEHIVMSKKRTVKKDETLQVVPLAEGLWREKQNAGGTGLQTPD